MIHVDFAEPAGNKRWTTWRTDAVRETGDLVDRLKKKRTYKIRGPLYKRMRSYYLEAFAGKCAYCEAKLVLDQGEGDVEHYRPKGRVRDTKNRPVLIRVRGAEPLPHPGYPWLAYDWRNLLPACIACNRLGKWDRFPVGRFRASAPGEEERERPLLLHPVFDEPAEHLLLDPETGLIAGKTRRGWVSIELLGLNRDGLPEERADVFFLVDALVAKAELCLQHGDVAGATRRITILVGYARGTATYSWAGRLAIAQHGDALERMRDALPSG